MESLSGNNERGAANSPSLTERNALKANQTLMQSAWFSAIPASLLPVLENMTREACGLFRRLFRGSATYGEMLEYEKQIYGIFKDLPPEWVFAYAKQLAGNDRLFFLSCIPLGILRFSTEWKREFVAMAHECRRNVSIIDPQRPRSPEFFAVSALAAHRMLNLAPFLKEGERDAITKSLKEKISLPFENSMKRLDSPYPPNQTRKHSPLPVSDETEGLIRSYFGNDFQVNESSQNTWYRWSIGIEGEQRRIPADYNTTQTGLMPNSDLRMYIHFPRTVTSEDDKLFFSKQHSLIVDLCTFLAEQGFPVISKHTGFSSEDHFPRSVTGYCFYMDPYTARYAVAFLKAKGYIAESDTRKMDNGMNSPFTFLKTGDLRQSIVLRTSNEVDEKTIGMQSFVDRIASSLRGN